jgi:adenylylsulfate kinase-like enzyme
VNAPYETPAAAAITLDTAGESADQSADELFAAVIERVVPAA